MKHGISFIHISEKNLTFEGISDANEYDFICLCIFLEMHYFSLSHTVCEVTYSITVSYNRGAVVA